LTKKFIFIDYLRILAFSSVFAGHLFPGYMSALLPSYLTVLWAGGAFGVVLFFLISGYVVTLALFRETPRQFAIRRFFRIYPAFTVALLVSYLVLPPPPLNEFFGQLSLLGDFFSTPFALEGVDWTLRIEVLFYICLLFWGSILKKIPSTWKSFTLLMFLLFSIIFLPVFPAATWNSGYGSVFFPIFFGGIGLALLRIKRLTVIQASLVYASSFFVTIYQQNQIKPALDQYGPFVTVAFVIFLVCFLGNSLFVSTRLVLWLSSLTYPTYLFHYFLFPYLDTQVSNQLIAWDFLVQSASSGYSHLITLVLFFTLMSLFVRFIDNPINALAKRFSKEQSKNSE